MLTVNKKLMKQAQQFISLNSKTKAIDLLLANGCDLQAASEIVNNFYKTENYADQFIVEHLQKLLPKQKVQAAKRLTEYYEISIDFSRKMVDKIADKGDLSTAGILKVLQELEPRNKSDEQKQSIALNYQSHLLKLLVNGHERVCIDMLINDLNLELDDAHEYVEELKSNLRRSD